MNKNDIHVLSRAVIIVDDHILLAYDPRSSPSHYYELNVPFYYLPGGHIDFKESAQDAILREIEEETGYAGEYERFLGVIAHAWHFSDDEVCCHTHEINLISKVHVSGLGSQMAISQKEEHVAFHWIPLTKLNDVDLRPAPLKTLIPKWMDGSLHFEFVSVVP